MEIKKEVDDGRGEQSSSKKHKKKKVCLVKRSSLKVNFIFF